MMATSSRLFQAGFNRERLIDCEVNEELLCSICMQTLRDPLADPCEHMFCTECILSWLPSTESQLNHYDRSFTLLNFALIQNNEHQDQLKKRCPISGRPLHQSDLGPVPRIVRNLLAKLHLSCEYKLFGCTLVLSYDQVTNHELNCDYNPHRLIRCDRNCGATYRYGETHNCITFLSQKVHQLTRKVIDMASVIQSNGEQIKTLYNLVNQSGSSLRSTVSIQNLCQI